MMRFRSFESVAILVLACASVAATPYDDAPQHRFKLTLPEGWAISPRFGDVHGMVFQRSVPARGRIAVSTLVVHVDSVDASDVVDFANQLEAALRTQPGFARKGEKSETVAGTRALVRDYRALVSKKPRIEKAMRAYYVESGGHRYQLHFEALDRDFADLARQVPKIVASFVPGEDEVTSAGSMSRRSRVEGGEVAASLTGRWVNEDGLLMILGGDGSFALADSMGRWEVRGNILTMIIPGKGQESFTFALDEVAGTITLSSPNLGSPMVYRRARGEEGKEAQDTSSATHVSTTAEGASDLIGRWTTPTQSGALVLDLREDRTFSMGSTSGKWSLRGASLTLTSGAGEDVTYTVRRSGESLRLSGGDLEAEVVFSR